MVAAILNLHAQARATERIDHLAIAAGGNAIGLNAQQLARLGVDIIEAGFPFASPGDFNAVQRIAETVGTADGPIICGLARAASGDIKACADAVAPAANRRIHTFIATSDIHLEHKLRKTRAEVLAITAEMVDYARSLVDDVEFSCEDAGRSDPEFMYEVIEAAIKTPIRRATGLAGRLGGADAR